MFPIEGFLEVCVFLGVLQSVRREFYISVFDCPVTRNLTPSTWWTLLEIRPTGISPRMWEPTSTAWARAAEVAVQCFRSKASLRSGPSLRSPVEPCRCPILIQKGTAEGIVALFNASDDTIDMVQNLLTKSGGNQTLIWCHFADLKKGVVDFGKYMDKHNPEVVIFDLSPPYDENWQFFKTMRDAKTMKGRGVVLTTT